MNLPLTDLHPVEIFIIGLFVIALLFFIVVIIIVIRFIFKKEEEVRPIHIQPTSLSQMQSNYSGSQPFQSHQSSYYQPDSSYSQYQFGTGANLQHYQPITPPQMAFEEAAAEQVAWEGSDQVEPEPGPEVGPSPDSRAVTRPPKIVASSTSDDKEDEMTGPAGISMEPLALPLAQSSQWEARDVGPPAGVFTDGLQSIARMVMDHHGPVPPTYPAAASSYPGTPGPSEMGSPDHYGIRDYSYPADGAYEGTVSAAGDYYSKEEPMPYLTPLEPQTPRVEGHGKPYKHTMDESIKCSICLGYIKTGLPLISCICTKSYHVSCAVRMGYCPICGSDLLDYEDRIVARDARSDSFEGIRKAFREIDRAGTDSDSVPVTNIIAPVDRTVAALTERQKKKLRDLLEKYETTARAGRSRGMNTDE